MFLMRIVIYTFYKHWTLDICRREVFKLILILELKMSYINISEILPTRTKYGFEIQKEILRNKILTWYKTQGRTVEFTFPRKLILNDKFFIGFGLSIGDGLNNPSIENTHYNFSNSNFYLVKIISDWLEEFFEISSNKLQIFLYTKTSNKNVKNSILEVEKLFSIKSAKLRIYFSERHSKDVLMIQTSNTIFQLIYSRLFHYLMPIIITNTNFRRSFLKGLFAAEGHIKRSIYNTIEHIDFSFNPNNETSLAEFIQNCLLIEGIKANIKKDIVYFCGYENMLKFYVISIIDLHKDKKEKFIRLCRNAHIIAHFNNGLLDKLRNKISQKKLAENLGCSQPLISKSYKNRCLSIDNISKVMAYLEINKEDLSQYISHLTVSNTKISNKESIEFLILNKLST